MNNITSQSQLCINFPTISLIRHFEGSLVDDLNLSLAKLIKSLETENRGKQGTTSAQGGYHTKTDFLDSDNSSVNMFVNDLLVPSIKDYMAQYYQIKLTRPVEITRDTMSIQGWGNIMRKGEWNAPHNHTAHDNRISAVYYIKVPDCPRPEGSLQFENPNQISTKHGEYGNIKFHPSSGDLILFPSYQIHFSHPFYSDDERILIASDIIIEDYFKAKNINNFITLDIGSG